METNSGILDEDQVNCFKVDSTKTDDHISVLPEDILSFILSFLTIRDAVKTRVLSPRWRYLGTSTCNLNFDLFTLFGINFDYAYLYKNSVNLWEGKLRFIRAVDQFLQLYKNPKLFSFKVCYCLGDESAYHIDKWISIAVTKQTEILELKFKFIPKSCEPYVFPCHLLPQGSASQLNHLWLEGCRLRPPPNCTNSLNSLLILVLIKVPLDQSSFHDILCGCINLKSLALMQCRLPQTFFIGGNLVLKRLVLEHCRGAEKIEVSLINLAKFEYIGAVDNLTFVGVPSLKNVYINAYVKMTNYMFNGLAEDLPQLQNLSQVLYTDLVRPIPANGTKFRDLIKLELMVILAMDFNLLSLAFILNASPSLQKFHLALQHWGSGYGQKWEYSKQLYYQLKEVEISGFRDTCNSLGLAMYLLNNAVGLERMKINTRRRMYHGAGNWTYAKSRVTESEKNLVRHVLMKENVKGNVKLIVL